MDNNLVDFEQTHIRPAQRQHAERTGPQVLRESGDLERPSKGARGKHDSERPVGGLAVLHWSPRDLDGVERACAAVDVRTARERQVAIATAQSVLGRIYPMGEVELRVVEHGGSQTVLHHAYHDEGHYRWFVDALFVVDALNRSMAPDHLERLVERLYEDRDGFVAWFAPCDLTESPRDRLLAGLDEFFGWWVSVEDREDWMSRRLLAHVRLLRSGAVDSAPVAID